MQNVECKISQKIAISLLKESVDEVPRHEATEFSDKHKEGRWQEFGAVEAEGYSDDITHEWYPREECQPRAILIDLCLLLGEGFGLNTELLDSLPLADATYAIRGESSEEVAGCGYGDNHPRRASCHEHTNQQHICAEWHNRSRQKRADKEPEVS